MVTRVRERGPLFGEGNEIHSSVRYSITLVANAGFCVEVLINPSEFS